MAQLYETPAESSLSWLHERASAAMRKAQTFIDASRNARLLERWPNWHGRFDELLRACQAQVRVEISLVGGTGAGKSTLLNALIGKRLLPVSNMKACTAAITEVAFAPGQYRARIEFLSRESWQKEIELLKADYRDAHSNMDAENDAATAVELSRSARDKLKAVYRLDDDDFAEGTLPELVEPPEVRRCLDRGAIDVSGSDEDFDAFRKEIEKYLHSKHPFWPIVRNVRILGPFEPLSDGLAIVDLPGINDPNEAREEVTKRHLKTCRFVWIVFNIKRCLTKDMVALIQSEDFLRQIVMDGRADSLTFVGTAADDLDPESGREEFGLDDDAGIEHIVAARNKEVREVVKTQLEELAARFGSMTRAERKEIKKLTEKLVSCSVFTVSAKEFFRLVGQSKSNSAGFTHADQTEIPALRGHMTKVCRSYGIAAHSEAIERRLRALLQEIRAEVQAHGTALRNKEELTERQQERLGAAIKTARSFLDQQLIDADERLGQDLEAHKELLSERLKHAIERARNELGRTLERWDQVHWNTLRAVCRRKGVHSGKCRNDFPGDIAKPILDGIAFAWSEFFGEKLTLTLGKWAKHLKQKSEEHQERLLGSVKVAAEVEARHVESIAAVFGAAEKVLDEMLAQTRTAMETRILERQRGLHETIPSQIRANLAPAFERAEQEQGTGMKSRMMAILREHTRQVSTVMFDDARESIQADLRGLNDWLRRQYGEMTAAVRRCADLAGDNLTGSELLRGTLAEQREELNRMLAWVGELDGLLEKEATV